MAQEPDAQRYTRLPEQVKLEDTIASQDAVDHPEEKTEHARETEWLLRSAAG